ncbi:DUF3375 domain-containing protein [Diaphorobacter aerolatus]|uniref:DUF3375 domain-containing protein n=1 Tax=Diaphorobacter aerolatus TaxID=1288495 RepID=A0A7H0GGJ2_9BURK|nr:DUF3375 domain-containing protein [Diaphorobacter aerolatus]QNP47408.1 DUF3375 domain-containing protein [Diaphorobacter aerolatus]
MSTVSQQRTQNYVSARRTHPAWMLLASRRAPLVLSCLESVFEHRPAGVPFEEAVQSLCSVLLAHASQPEFEIDETDIGRQARADLRDWIRKSLVVERQGQLFETDAFKMALRFVAQLDRRMMTSTASRLAVVQREIDHLATQLNPDPQAREEHIQRKLDELQCQMDEVRSGHVPQFSEAQAVEGIREVYVLATSLRADFQRVEDSWREADRNLRQSIISEQLHRGEVVDKLLDGHDHLLSTLEGRVFDNFHQQLGDQDELNAMRLRIIQILNHPATAQALDDVQRSSLRTLVLQLIKESKLVQAVRARSEREVSQFMKSGQAAENHRVGQLVNDILQQASRIDWRQQSVRRSWSPLPPVGVGLGISMPLIERLRVKSLEDGGGPELMLQSQQVGVEALDADFWLAFDGLDRYALLEKTLEQLRLKGEPMTLAELARQLPPHAHDLETLALWLGMAREAGLELQDDSEQIETEDGQQRWCFTVPRVQMDGAALDRVDWEL